MSGDSRAEALRLHSAYYGAADAGYGAHGVIMKGGGRDGTIPT